MYTILLTRGRYGERDGEVAAPPHRSYESALDQAIAHALDLLRDRQREGGNGLPDGFCIKDDNGKEVHAQWVGLVDAARS